MPLDTDTTVQLGRVHSRLRGAAMARFTRGPIELENPAAHLVVESKKSGGKTVQRLAAADSRLRTKCVFALRFEGKDVQMAYFTGLEVSHEPGQWSVWAGVVLMGFGLALVFYFVHARVWAVPVRDARGNLQLWIGGTREQKQRCV